VEAGRKQELAVLAEGSWQGERSQRACGVNADHGLTCWNVTQLLIGMEGTGSGRLHYQSVPALVSLGKQSRDEQMGSFKFWLLVSG